MKNGYILNKREVISFLLECRARHCNFADILQIDFSNSDNSDQIPSIERMERTETISPRGSYIGCPRILSCFSPSRPIMTTKKKKKKKEKIQIEERGKIEIKLRNVNKRKTKGKSDETGVDIARGSDRRANRRRSTWKRGDEKRTERKEGKDTLVKHGDPFVQIRRRQTKVCLLACLLNSQAWKRGR